MTFSSILTVFSVCLVIAGGALLFKLGFPPNDPFRKDDLPDTAEEATEKRNRLWHRFALILLILGGALGIAANLLE